MTTRFQSVQHTEFGQLRTRSRVSKEVFCSIALLVAIFADVQPICSQSAGVEGSPGIPHLMKFSGVLNEGGSPSDGVLRINFAVYAARSGGTPLWEETQDVQVSEGRYTVFLGKTLSEGIPASIFSSGQLRWMGIKVVSQGERAEELQPRTLLTTVPYAFKAGDADTLGGLPASAFLKAPLSSSGEDSSVTTLSAAGKATVVTPASSLTVTTPGGTANTIPKFSSASEIINSQITDNGVVHLMNLENVLFADQFTGADCGAKINAADSALGSTAGEIWVNQNCGTAWTSVVSLSANHTVRLIQCGTYTTTHTITLAGGGAGIIGTPQGEASGTCTLKAANGAALSTVVSMPGNITFLQDVTIDGNRANSGTSGGTGVAADLRIGGSGGRQELMRVTVQNSSGDGVYINGGCCGKIDRLFSTLNVGDGLFVSNVGDVFIISSEFENNTLNGVELFNSPAARITHSDFGTNGSGGGKGLKVYGTAAGGHSSYEIITGNQFGNNYQEDLYIIGFDTSGGNYSAVQSTIMGNSFIGSGFRANATYPDVFVQDGYQHQIVGNWFNSGTGGHLSKYGLELTETVSGRAVASTVTGNSFNAGFTTGLYLDGNANQSHFAANSEGTSSFSRLGPHNYLPNNNGLYWKDASGNVQNVIFMGGDNATYIWGHPVTKAINFQPNPGSNVLSLTPGLATVNGTLTANVKNFKIDHPLDPANKFLYHSSVESPDMKDFYDGIAVLDGNGEAEVQLPDWFEALNRDLRYQLTCIGGFALSIYQKKSRTTGSALQVDLLD